MKRFRKFYWRRKSYIKQQTLFDDAPILTINLRHNTSIERKEVMEAEFILKSRANWSRDYLDLVEAGWKWEKAAYIAWASAPKKLRKPEFLYQFAELIGANRKTIYRWKEDFAMNMIIRERILSPLLDHRRDVIDALVESATNPDARNYSDRKMFLEITEIYVPGKVLLDQVRGEGPGFIENKSDEELEKIILNESNRLPDEERSDELVDSDAGGHVLRRPARKRRRG